MSLSLCICTRDRARDLELTLGSLMSQVELADRVIVSDDGSGPATRLVCRSAAFPVLYTQGPRQGLAANRNHALSLVETDYVMFLDDDCRLGAGFLKTALSKIASAEAVAGSQNVVVTGPELKSGRLVEPSDQTFLGFQSQPYRYRHGLNTVVINSAVFPVTKAKLHQFDARLRYGAEEADFATRLVADGVAIFYAPDVPNVHIPSMEGRSGYDTESAVSRIYVTMKRYAFTERRYLRAVAFALIAPLHTVAAGARRGGLRGMFHAVAVVFRSAAYFASYVQERRQQGRNVN